MINNKLNDKKSNNKQTNKINNQAQSMVIIDGIVKDRCSDIK